MNTKEQHESYMSALRAIDIYLNHGAEPGGQVRAMLENNLQLSIGMADEHRAQILRDIVVFLYNEIPSCAWGSEDKVNAWMALDDAARARVLDARLRELRHPVGAGDEEVGS